MLAAGSKGATQSEILNKERFLTVREQPTQTPTQNYNHKNEFLVYLYQLTGVETLES